MKANYFGDYEYRYQSACGLQRRKIYNSSFNRVNGTMFEEMTADELEHCANVMRRALSGGGE
ncbi:hypothetical protein ACFOLL_04570 [Falsochrobactrum ovis]|uniref:Uncharacterized protein n=1 Tax=Falsochrobactrum ovis TaxID=1293442 RepID=A0A364JVZ4_9HYPH|nr:hypothetical protein [Falsochrobactrum ovis]RAK29109.1 hypothetical protein C7374_105160 [Falsochrobactrum ovis]